MRAVILVLVVLILAVNVETGSVKVGTTNTTVKVPKLEVVQPGNEAAATTNNTM